MAFQLKFSKIYLVSFLLLWFGVFSDFLLQNVQCQHQANNPQQFTEIQTELGRIRGLQIRTNYNNPAIAFMGIPYALAPVANRRFKKPIQQPKWSPNTLMATGYQPCCPQLDINGLPHGDEDCLYLNIFVPVKSIDQSEQFIGTRRFPVMVYIQGESFENGDAALYGAEHLLDWDVILVTFNYRVGILGFFSTGDEHAPGNWGLYDQLLVLQFVRDHIESFSGDPNRVTLFGQGAGAASAILHLISPLSSGLFNRVIAQSGSPLCSWSMENNPQNVAAELAKKIGCSQKSGNSELVKCLRSAKLASLLKAQQDGKIFGEYPHQFLPVVEEVGLYYDRMIPKDPKLLISQGNYKRIPLIMGYNQDETSFLYPLILNKKMFGDSGTMKTYLEEKLLPRFIRATIMDRNSPYDFIKSNSFKFKTTAKDHERDIQQNILYKYFNFLNSKNFTDMAWRFVNMSTDALYGSCIDETLRLYSAASTTLSSTTVDHQKLQRNFMMPFANITYKYVFGYRGRNSMLNLILNSASDNSRTMTAYNGDQLFPPNLDLNHVKMSVCHGDELFYLFNLKFSSKKPEDNRDLLTQRKLLHLWTDFAKHGFAPFTPNMETPYWPSYTTQKPITYLIGNDKSIIPLDGYRDSATHFWVRYLPAISSSTISASASMVNKPPIANLAGSGAATGGWNPSFNSRTNPHLHHQQRDEQTIINSLAKLKTFAWSMLTLSLILFVFVVILMALLYYQRRRQSFSAENSYTIPRSSSGLAASHLDSTATTPKTFAQFLASRRTSISGLY